MSAEKPKAVVYVRVSSASQVEGTSLETQEERCREYAEREGYEVVKVFREEGVSAKMWQRPEFIRVLDFLKAQKGKVRLFIMYKIDRISRSVEDQYVILKALRDAGVEMRSATENIDDTPAGKLLRNMLWAIGEFDNSVRAERCKAGMVARFHEGYWIHPPVPGYLMQKDPVSKRSLLVHDPERAPHIRWAFEQRADSASFDEIARGMNRRGYRTRYGRKIKESQIARILGNPIYIGLMRSFGEQVEGKHEPLVSKELWYRVQAVGKQKHRNNERRAVLNPEFPLRRFVFCSSCGKSITGSAPRGRSKKYAYYHHHSPGCPVARTIHKTDLEENFRQRLRELVPNPQSFSLVKAVILDVWQERTKKLLTGQQRVNRRIEELMQEKANLLELKRKNPLLYTDEEFLQQKRDLDEQITTLQTERGSEEEVGRHFDQAVERAFAYLRHPVERWEEADIHVKTEFQRRIFPEGLPFDGEKFGTAKLSLVFGLFQAVSVPKSRLVEMGGIEPPSE